MSFLRHLPHGILLAVLGAYLAAQPVVVPSHLTVSQVVSGLPVHYQYTSMAADRFGNVYVMDEPPSPAAVGPIVHRIRSDGTVDPYFATGFGDAGELATNPVDGLVYLVDFAPWAPTLTSRVWRLELAGGATQVHTIPLQLRGFTIDNQGLMFFGGSASGTMGLYAFDPLSGSLAWLDPGFGLSAVLQSLVSGDVLVADGRDVRRWTPGGTGTQPFYMAPAPNPNEVVSVTSLARTPFHQPGAGALVGVRSFVTVSMGGAGLAISTDLAGGNATQLASESFSFPDLGFHCIASGFQHDLFWLTVSGGATSSTPASGVLHHITQAPATGVSGSLFVNAQPGTISVDLHGPAGQAFILGVVSAVGPAPAPLFAPPWGLIDLDLFAPSYVPVFDGVGLFGAPDPVATIPGMGRFTWTFTIPPITFPTTLRGQALILGPLQAPNGAFFVSNVATFTVL